MNSADKAVAYNAFLEESPAGIDPEISRWYGDLSNVPGRGRSYALRLLALSRPGDLIRMHPDLYEAAMELFEHYTAAGITVTKPENILWSDQFGATIVAPNDNRRPVVFMFDDAVHALRPNVARYRATRLYEDKTMLSQLAVGTTPSTVVVRNETWRQYLRQPWPTPEGVWNALGRCPGRLKAGFCASGNNNEAFTDLSSLATLMQQPRWSRIDYVVQRDVGTQDVGMNYYATEDAVYFLFGSDQISVNACHEGNLETDAHNTYCRPLTDPLAVAAQRRGLRGFFNFDLRVDPCRPEAWVIECNARMTAPVYGWALARQHAAPWFGIVNLKHVPHDTIDGLIPTSLRYQPKKGEGVLVHNPGPLASEHACSVTVLAQHREAGLELLQSLLMERQEQNAELKRAVNQCIQHELPAAAPV